MLDQTSTAALADLALSARVDRKELLSALTHACFVAEKNSVIPILQNVMLTERDGALRVTSTDLDMELVSTVAAEVSPGFAATVPAHTLKDALKNAIGNDVVLKLGDETVTLLCGVVRASLPTRPCEDFPLDTPMTKIETYTAALQLASDTFASMLRRTSFAISTEETRYYLQGVYLHFAGTMLRAVTTDGHRLAQVEFPAPVAPAGADKMPGVIIPRKTVAMIGRLIGKPGRGAAPSAGLDVHQAGTRFTFGCHVLRSKIIDGEFPDYRHITPTGGEVATVNKAELTLALKSVSTALDKDYRVVRLVFSHDTLKLNVTNPNNCGTASISLDVDYSGEDLDIGFNSTYLQSILEAIGDEAICIPLTDAGSPTLFRGRDDVGALFVCMPMRR